MICTGPKSSKVGEKSFFMRSSSFRFALIAEMSGLRYMIGISKVFMPTKIQITLHPLKLCRMVSFYFLSFFPLTFSTFFMKKNSVLFFFAAFLLLTSFHPNQSVILRIHLKKNTTYLYQYSYHLNIISQIGKL